MKPVFIIKRKFKSNKEIDKQVLEDHFGFNFFLKPKGFCGKANFYGFNYFSDVDMVNTTPAPNQFDEWREAIEDSKGHYDYHAFSNSVVRTKQDSFGDTIYYLETHYINSDYQCAYKFESELFVFEDDIEVSDKVKTEKLSYDFLSGYYSTFEKILDALEIDY